MIPGQALKPVYELLIAKWPSCARALLISDAESSLTATTMRFAETGKKQAGIQE